MTAAQKLRDEGRQERLLTGQRSLLCRQLEARFGPLPPALRAQLYQGTPEELERWALRIVTAPASPTCSRNAALTVPPRSRPELKIPGLR
jgi:hypothetical protein